MTENEYRTLTVCLSILRREKLKHPSGSRKGRKYHAAEYYLIEAMTEAFPTLTKEEPDK